MRESWSEFNLNPKDQDSKIFKFESWLAKTFFWFLIHFESYKNFWQLNFSRFWGFGRNFFSLILFQKREMSNVKKELVRPIFHIKESLAFNNLPLPSGLSIKLFLLWGSLLQLFRSYFSNLSNLSRFTILFQRTIKNYWLHLFQKN